jgi:hypothetical protein
MALHEAERRQRQRKQTHKKQRSRPHSKPIGATAGPPRDRDLVLTFKQWCELNGFSKATGRRVLAAGKCRYLRLSERRIGIRASDNAEYQESCLRGGE